MSRILVHFSCGAASAVAAKVAVLRYGDTEHVEIINCRMRDEHPDNERFLVDVEKWVGRTVIRLEHPKHKYIDDLFLSRGYIGSRKGAICTAEMKRDVAEAYSHPDDRHVFGYTADEPARIARFTERHPDTKCLWLLASAGITKEDCYHVLTAHHIELPAMYRLGYDHSNCIGCVKGGKGYWNKIRRDFPEVFAKRAAVQRAIGPGACFRSGGTGFMLDELGPDEGHGVKEPNIECGVMCEGYAGLLEEAAAAAPEDRGAGVEQKESEEGNGVV